MFFLINFSYKQVGYSCPTFTVYHSRAGGTSKVSNCSSLEMFPKCRGLDSRLRGNDGRGLGKNCLSRFRRHFAYRCTL